MTIMKNILILLCLLCSACGNEEAYLTAPVEQRDITAICTATGTINPVMTVEVGTQVSGRIKALHADYNTPVTSGQLIAEIDPAAFEAQREQARANLLAARASLDQAEANLKDSRRSFKRTHELHAGKVIGQSEMDAAETKLSVAEARSVLPGAGGAGAGRL